MPRDPRTYISLHDGIVDHPKVGPLSDAAFRLYVETLCWCSRHLTDGRIPGASWSRMGTPAARKALADAGLVEAAGAGFEVHDYLEHQRSADEVAALRAKRAEAGRRGGLAKAQHTASNDVASASPVAKQTASKSVAETETDTDKNNNPSRTRSDALPDGFAEFWLAYPRKTAKPNAIKAYRKALRDTAPSVLLDGAAQYARERQGQDESYTAHPATWLNGRRWEDAPATPARPSWDNWAPQDPMLMPPAMHWSNRRAAGDDD